MLEIQPMAVPSVNLLRDSNDYGKFSIYPLERGYGVTIGNALRRVLLSSLEGYAVTSIHIDGIDHEFSSIPGVREDVLRVILQIKQLRLMVQGSNSAELTLNASGKGDVVAADIKCPYGVEIVNPELYLFNIDDPSASVSMTMTVEKGRGYIPANMRKGKVGIGDIPVDAIFTPIEKVNWNVENILYHDKVDYEKLEFEIWTDATMKPEIALHEATGILVQQLRYIFGIKEQLPEINIVSEEEKEEIEKLYDPIEVLGLSRKTYNALKNAEYTTIKDLIHVAKNGIASTNGIRRFGEGGLTELREKLQEKGYLDVKSDTKLESKQSGLF